MQKGQTSLKSCRVQKQLVLQFLIETSVWVANLVVPGLRILLRHPHHLQLMIVRQGTKNPKWQWSKPSNQALWILQQATHQALGKQLDLTPAHTAFITKWSPMQWTTVSSSKSLTMKSADFLMKNRICLKCVSSNKYVSKDCSRGKLQYKICLKKTRHCTSSSDQTCKKKEFNRVNSACSQVFGQNQSARSCVRIVLLEVFHQDSPSAKVPTYAYLCSSGRPVDRCLYRRFPPRTTWGARPRSEPGNRYDLLCPYSENRVRPELSIPATGHKVHGLWERECYSLRSVEYVSRNEFMWITQQQLIPSFWSRKTSPSSPAR